jgi:hypothetical protein
MKGKGEQNENKNELDIIKNVWCFWLDPLASPKIISKARHLSGR